MSRRTTFNGQPDRLGEKAIACLRMASLKFGTQEWSDAYDAACQRWGEKAVLAKFEELVERGYMECGVSARSGWLEERGRAALAATLSNGTERPFGARNHGETPA